MKIVLKGLVSTYELEHMVRLFYPQAELCKDSCTKGDVMYVRFNKKRSVYALRVSGEISFSFGGARQDDKTELCAPLYKLMRDKTGKNPPWGMLTGVRPVNLLRKFIRLNGEEKGKQIFLEQNFVTPEKYSLAKKIINVQAPILKAMSPKSYSLYISIPFCPSRCAYCSFVSRTIEHERNLVAPYLDVLFGEMADTAEIARKLSLKLETIYIGGGTPTSLSLGELDSLLAAVAKNFDTSAVKEYTVEAGRPDCTDFAKLKLIKSYGVSRISINPQTMQNSVLHTIGRRHSAEDILRCMDDARRAGHGNINMDLIAGLPSDTAQGFAKTLAEILPLDPENITLHSLTLKKASNIVIDKSLQAGIVQEKMLEEAYGKFNSSGYNPYYLYRQKNTPNNLENTGWAKKGFECLYNIFIMEETQTVLAVGAGATSKLVNNENGLINRFFNYKYPAEYISGYDILKQRKKVVEEFYG